MDQEDPVTSEKIREEDAVRFSQYGVPFCFNIDTLARHTLSSGSWNPLNNAPLPQDITNRVTQYIQDTNIPFHVELYDQDDRNPVKKIEIRMNRTHDIGGLIIEIHKALGIPEYLGIYDMHLYLYSLLEPLSMIPSNLIPIYSRKNTGDIGERYHKLYKYSISKHIDWIGGIVPEQYKIDAPPIIESNELDNHLLMDLILILDGRDTGYIRYVIEKFMKDSLVEAKVCDRFIDSVQLMNRATNACMHEIMEIQSIIDSLYSRIVDPWNISSQCADMYRRSKWDPPFKLQ